MCAPGAIAQDFGVPTPLGFDSDRHPSVATDGAGGWVAVWRSSEDVGGAGTDADVFSARSLDGGATWSTPAVVNDDAPTNGHDQEPDLASGGGTFVAVWTGNLASAGFDIGFARSTDTGATWTPAAALDPAAAAESNSNREPKIATDGLGNCVTVWGSTDTLGGTLGEDFDVLVARSSDDGASWTAPVALNDDAATDSDADWHAEIETDGLGTWIVTWPSGPYVLVSRSADNGATWSSAQSISSSSPKDPHLATDGSGGWLLVWADIDFPVSFDRDIYFSHSIDGGVTWTARATVNDYASSDTAGDHMPRVVWDSGTWLVVWPSDEKLGAPIPSSQSFRDKFLASRSTDATSWSSAGFLMLHNAHRPGSHAPIDLASDGSGNFVALWQSDEAQALEKYIRVARSGLDTDTDGILDANELPLYGTDPLLADTEGDGVEDGIEVWGYGSNPLADEDIDGDGLSNATETNTYGTSPLLFDTDGDGYSDGEEVAAGSDPNNPASVPPSGETVWGPIQSVLLSVDPVTDLDLTLTVADSDTKPFTFDFGGLSARVHVRNPPGYGWVASGVTFLEDSHLFHEGAYFEVLVLENPALMGTAETKHWEGTLTNHSAAAAITGPGASTLDLSGLAFQIDAGEVAAAIVGESPTVYPMPTDPPVTFATGPIGTILLQTDVSGFNTNVTMTIPINGSDVGPGGTWALQGDLVLTGSFPIAVLPIPVWVGAIAALFLATSGRRFADSHPGSTSERDSATLRNGWHARRDSNPRPSGSKTDPNARSDAGLRRRRGRSRRITASRGV
jgi:hypothetical protein